MKALVFYLLATVIVAVTIIPKDTHKERRLSTADDILENQAFLARVMRVRTNLSKLTRKVMGLKDKMEAWSDTLGFYLDKDIKYSKELTKIKKVTSMNQMISDTLKDLEKKSMPRFIENAQIKNNIVELEAKKQKVYQKLINN